jgi:hypothetical protein
VYVNHGVLESVANLIDGALSNGLPSDDEAEWKGFDEEDAAALDAVLDEITWNDLLEMARGVAARMPEPTGQDSDEQGDKS